MSNLLLAEQKKILRQAYLMRAVTVVLFFVFALLLFALIALVPSYFATKLQAEVIESEMRELQDDAFPVKESEQLATSVREITERTEILKKWFAETFMYNNILKVIAERQKGIAITAFSSQRKGASMVVSGTARERDDLLAFKNALEKSKKFKTIELPVSNLAQKEDIDFSITVTFVGP